MGSRTMPPLTAAFRIAIKPRRPACVAAALWPVSNSTQWVDFETFHPENGAAACPLAAEIPIDAVRTLLRLERSGSIFTHLCHLRFPAERVRWAVSP